MSPLDRAFMAKNMPGMISVHLQNLDRIMAALEISD